MFFLLYDTVLLLLFNRTLFLSPLLLKYFLFIQLILYLKKIKRRRVKRGRMEAQGSHKQMRPVFLLTFQCAA
jgi:hypothetical protein